MFYCVCYFTLRNVPNTFAFLKKLCVLRSILENRVDIKSLKVKSHFEFTRGFRNIIFCKLENHFVRQMFYCFCLFC